MAIPGYLWMTDEQGNQIKSTVKINGREGSAEIIDFRHEIRIPSDLDTGKLTGTRKHEALKIVKEFCSASPILAKACCDGKTLKQVKISWYHINNSGSEEEYFRHTLEDVKVVSTKPIVHDVKAKDKEKYGHLEEIAFRYKTIKWEYLDGNISTQDTWTDKA